MAQRWINWVSCWIKPAATDVPKPGKKDFLKLCQGIINKSKDLIKISGSSQKYLMNEKQCGLLVGRLSETLAKIPHSSHLHEKTSPVLQELHHVFEDSHRLIQSCCVKSATSNAERLRAAIEQGDMKGTFAQLLYDVEWHTDVLQSIVGDSGNPSITFEAARCEGNLSPNDKLALENAKKEDDKALNDRLGILELGDPTEKKLAVQLLEHRDAQATKAQSRTGLRHGVLFLDPKKMEKHIDGKQIGIGSFGAVQETDVLGGSFAVKIIDEPEDSIVQNNVSTFMKEMEAMQGLGHHPHIVRLYCYSRFGDRCFLVMERMDCDLDRILKHKNNYLIVEKVALMLEIAEGMRYIHSMHMAHRDLKPGNVLVNLEDSTNKSSRACSVKIADFGLTKTKEASKTYKDQTANTGTVKYMAPEVIDFDRNLKPEFNPTKADVYSFGIMCFEILTGKTAFRNRITIGESKKQVKGSGDLRSDLLQISGVRLESLIRRCYDDNHRSRPDFIKICQELRYIKGLHLRGDHQNLQTKIDFTNKPGSTDYMTAQHQDVPQGHDIVSEEDTGQFSLVVASAKATPDRQGPWGRNEPSNKTGLFDHMAATIKWIRVKYQQDPPGVGLLQVGYLEANGQELMETYCDGVIGTTYTEIKLKPVEYIKQVSGCVATHPVSVGNGGTVGLYCVVSLTIHTNFKSYGPFGDETKSVGSAVQKWNWKSGGTFWSSWCSS